MYGVARHGRRPQLCFHLNTVILDGRDVFTQCGKCGETGNLTRQHTSHQAAQYTLRFAAREFHCSCVLINGPSGRSARKTAGKSKSCAGSFESCGTAAVPGTDRSCSSFMVNGTFSSVHLARSP